MKAFRGERAEKIDRVFQSDPGDLGRGVYYDTHKARAKNYGDILIERKLQFQNPLMLPYEIAYVLADKFETIRGRDGETLSAEQRLKNAEALTQCLLELGYDGLIAQRKNGYAEVVDYRSSQKGVNDDAQDK